MEKNPRVFFIKKSFKSPLNLHKLCNKKTSFQSGILFIYLLYT